MYLTNPTSFNASLTEAELICFNALVSATSAIPGRSAYLGQQPITGYNRWTFGLTKQVAKSEDFFLQNDIQALCFSGRATGIFANRLDVMLWQSQIIAALPLCSTGNVVQLKTTHISIGDARLIEAPNESTQILVWQGDIDFLCYIVTGGRANVVAETESPATTEYAGVMPLGAFRIVAMNPYGEAIDMLFLAGRPATAQSMIVLNEAAQTIQVTSDGSTLYNVTDSTSTFTFLAVDGVTGQPRLITVTDGMAMSLDTNISFVNSMRDAELQAFVLLTAYTHSIAGKQGYLGLQPIYGYNKWVFGITDSIESSPAFWSQEAPDPSCICFKAEARCVFLHRHEAQNWQMSIVRSLPYCSNSNIVQFEVDNLGEITSSVIDVPNESAKIQVWKASVSFKLYYKTGQR